MIKVNKSVNRQEERKLLLEYKLHNNIEARNKLIEAHQKFIYNEAFRYYKMYVAYTNNSSIYELDDFIMEANRALIRAIDAFDIKRSTRLLTYAGHWIKAYLFKMVYGDEHQENDIDVDTVEVEGEPALDLITIKIKLKEVRKILSPVEFFVISSFMGLTDIKPSCLHRYLCRKQQCVYYIKRKAKQKMLTVFTPAELSALLSLY